MVEGFRLLPGLVGPLLSTPGEAVWLIPTPAFRQMAFAGRADAEAFWTRTSNPEKALDNLLARDAIFSTKIAAAAPRHGLAVIAVNGAQDAAATAKTIACQFGL